MNIIEACADLNCNLKFGREGTLSDNALGVLCNLAVESKLEYNKLVNRFGEVV